MRRTTALLLASFCGACGTSGGYGGAVQPSPTEITYASQNLCAWYGYTPGTAPFAECLRDAVEGYSLRMACQPTRHDLSEATRCSAAYDHQVSRQQCLADILRSRGC